MDDFEFCGNVPKYPGVGPQPGGLTPVARGGFRAADLLPALTRVAQLNPIPEVWKTPGGIAY